jgi:hypothetical protein
MSSAVALMNIALPRLAARASRPSPRGRSRAATTTTTTTMSCETPSSSRGGSSSTADAPTRGTPLGRGEAVRKAAATTLAAAAAALAAAEDAEAATAELEKPMLSSFGAKESDADRTASLVSTAACVALALVLGSKGSGGGGKKN